MKAIGIGLLVLVGLSMLGSGHEILGALLLIAAVCVGLSGLANRLEGNSHGGYVSPLRAAQIEAEAITDQAEKDGKALVAQANDRATIALARAREFAAAEAKNGGWI